MVAVSRILRQSVPKTIVQLSADPNNPDAPPSNIPLLYPADKRETFSTVKLLISFMQTTAFLSVSFSGKASNPQCLKLRLHRVAAAVLLQDFDLDWPTVLQSYFRASASAASFGVNSQFITCALGWDVFEEFQVLFALLLVTPLLVLGKLVLQLQQHPVPLPRHLYCLLSHCANCCFKANHSALEGTPFSPVHDPAAFAHQWCQPHHPLHHFNHGTFLKATSAPREWFLPPPLLPHAFSVYLFLDIPYANPNIVESPPMQRCH